MDWLSIDARYGVFDFGSIGSLIVRSILADRSGFIPNIRVMYLLFALVLGTWSFVFLTDSAGTWFNNAMVAVVIFLTSALLIARAPTNEMALVQADPKQSALSSRLTLPSSI